MSTSLDDYISFLASIGKTKSYKNLEVDENFRMSRHQQMHLTGLLFKDQHLKLALINNELIETISDFCLNPEAETAAQSMEKITDFFIERYSRNCMELIQDHLQERNL